MSHGINGTYGELVKPSYSKVVAKLFKGNSFTNDFGLIRHKKFVDCVFADFKSYRTESDIMSISQIEHNIFYGCTFRNIDIMNYYIKMNSFIKCGFFYIIVKKSTVYMNEFDNCNGYNVSIDNCDSESIKFTEFFSTNFDNFVGSEKSFKNCSVEKNLIYHSAITS